MMAEYTSMRYAPHLLTRLQAREVPYRDGWDTHRPEHERDRRSTKGAAQSSWPEGAEQYVQVRLGEEA